MTPETAPPMRTLADEWREFHTKILKPINASILQQIEVRRGFYAGAAAMFGLLMQASRETVSDDEGDALLAKLDAEIQAFGDDLEAGRV